MSDLRTRDISPFLPPAQGAPVLYALGIYAIRAKSMSLYPKEGVRNAGRTAASYGPA
jgi:hypothetical protein